VGRHENIVNLLGVCSRPADAPLLAVLELAEQGSLRDVVAREDTSYREILRLAAQVARGMEFLASRRCVHRDLAARNVLVTRDGLAKVADFGLARDLEQSDYYRKVGEARLPVLWMSPESLFEGVSSTKSDVWSFGVLLWEVVSWGERPYPGLSPTAVVELVKEGFRMCRPAQCPLPLYTTMWSCWQVEASERPGWGELVTALQELCSDTLPGVYLQLPALQVVTPPSSPGSSASSVFESSAGGGPPAALPSQITRRFSEESGYQSKVDTPGYYSL